MKSLLLLSLFIFSASSSAEINVIYGEDNRLDYFETSNTLHKNLSLSTLGMISKDRMIKTSTGYELIDNPTLETAQNICPTEKFSNQIVAAGCTAFLVGPDIVVTAGHCLKSAATPFDSCTGSFWVFDFHMKSPGHDPSKNISASNVFECKEVLATEYSRQGLDYAIVRLDRTPTGRTPFKFRKTGKILPKVQLAVIGHPSGLPTKIAAGGKLTKNTLSDRFSSTLDTFHGNSGSPVFDAATGIVEGILIQGKTDYGPSSQSDGSSCQVVNVCDNNANNCSAGFQSGEVGAGEVVLRITTISHLIKNFMGK